VKNIKFVAVLLPHSFYSSW